MAFLLAVSNLRREGREIGRLVIDVQPFAVLQPTHHPVGYRGQQHFPTHLQRILGEKDRHHLRGRPDAQKRERVEDQAIHPLPHHRRDDGAGPQIFAPGPDLHPRQHESVRKLACPEGGDRRKDDARHLAEHRIISTIPLPCRGGRPRYAPPAPPPPHPPPSSRWCGSTNICPWSRPSSAPARSCSQARLPRRRRSTQRRCAAPGRTPIHKRPARPMSRRAAARPPPMTSAP